MKKNILKPKITTASCLLFSAFAFLYPFVLHAEQMLDVEDPFIVSKNSAYARVGSGYFKDALSAEETTLKTAQDRLGPTHPSLAPILIDLATIDRYLALYTDAESALRWALALREKNFGLKDPSVAESLDQLASLDSEMGRFEEAESYEKRAKNIEQKASPRPPHSVQTLIHLGQIQLQLQKNEEALKNLEESRSLLDEKPFSDGAESKNLKVEVLWALAEAYRSLGEIQKAESALLAARDQSKENGTNPIQEADSFLKLGDFKQAQSKKEQALPFYQSALLLLKPLVGVDSSYPLLPYITRLAAAEQDLGDPAGAKDLWTRALETSKNIFGETHPKTAVFLIHLAQSEEALGEKKSAAEHLKTALSIFRGFYDPDHPLVRRAEKRLQELTGN